MKPHIVIALLMALSLSASASFASNVSFLEKIIATKQITGHYFGRFDPIVFPPGDFVVVFNADGTWHGVESGNDLTPISLPFAGLPPDTNPLWGLWEIIDVDGDKKRVKIMGRQMEVDPDNIFYGNNECAIGCHLLLAGEAIFENDDLQIALISAFEDGTGQQILFNDGVTDRFGPIEINLKKDTIEDVYDRMDDYGIPIPTLELN